MNLTFIRVRGATDTVKRHGWMVRSGGRGAGSVLFMAQKIIHQLGMRFAHGRGSKGMRCLTAAGYLSR